MSTLTYLPSAIAQTGESWWNDLTGSKNTNPVGGGSYVSNAAVNQGLSGNPYGSAAAVVNTATTSALTSTGTVARAAGTGLLNTLKLSPYIVTVAVIGAVLVGAWVLTEKYG